MGIRPRPPTIDLNGAGRESRGPVR